MMNADFLERLTKRARAEHGLSPTHGEDDDLTLAPMLIPSDSGGAEPMDDEGDESEEEEDGDIQMLNGGGDQGDVQMLGPSGDSSDPQPGQSNSINAIAHSENQPEDIVPVDEADDDDDEGTTDDDDENRPKKREIMPTIRLSLELPRLPTPTTVERSVSLMAKEAGYALPADAAITLGASAVPEPELPPATTFQADGGPPPKRRRRKKILERDEGYDRDDPFVDDSEALMMEPKFYHAPARDGFFVASGVLELKSDEKKTRNRKPASKVVKRAPLNTTLSHQPLKPISKSQNHQPSTPTQAPPPPASTGLNATSQVINSRLPESTDPRPQQAQTNQKAQGVPSQATLQNQALPKTSHIPTSPKPTNLSLPPIQSTLNNANHRPSNLPPINSIADPTQTLGLATNPINLLDEDEDRSEAPLPDASRPTSRHHDLEKPQKRERSKTSDKPDLATLDKSKSARLSHLGTQAHMTQPSGSKSKSPLNPQSPDQSVQSQTAIAPLNLPRWSDVSQRGSSQQVASNAPPCDPPPSAGASDDPGALSWPTRLSYLRSRFGPVRKKDAPIAHRLDAAIQRLKVEVDAALPFEPRKFPPHLTPLTLEVAQLALDLNEYDGAFFSHLAQIFPYNTFTIKKLVMREILPNRKKYYEDQIDLRIERLKILIDEAMVNVMADHQKALADWKVAMEEWEKESNLRKTEPSTVPDLPPTNPISTENGAHAMDLTSETDKQPKPPVKTFKFTTAMRELYYEILKLEDEHRETIQETQALVDKNATPKDTNRKQLYLRLSTLWPEGFMSTTKLSREATNIRKKYDVPIPSSTPKPSS